MKKCTLFIFLLLGIAPLLSAQTLKTFKNTSWYIAEMITYENGRTADEQKLPSGRNTIRFGSDDKYELNFPDVNDMTATGFFVEENFTVALSNKDGKSYSYVFQINKRDQDEVIAVYVPFRPSPKKTVLILKRNRGNQSFSSNTASAANFSGIWRSREDTKGVRLKLDQRGAILHGVHDAKGTDLNRFSLFGEIEGDEAIVELHDQVSYKLVGRARIRKLPNGKLSWRVVNDENASFLRSRTIDNVELKKYGKYTN